MKILYIMTIGTLILFGMMLSGCGSNECHKKYVDDYPKMEQKGTYFCESKGLLFAGVYSMDFEEWKVVCMKKSPPELIHYLIK